MPPDIQHIKPIKGSLLDLPAELHHFICEYLEAGREAKSLATLLLSCRYMEDLVPPYLYKDVIITRANASSIFFGLDLDQFEVLEEPEFPIPPSKVDWRAILSPEFYQEWEALYGEDPHLMEEQYSNWPLPASRLNHDEYPTYKDIERKLNCIKMLNDLTWKNRLPSRSHMRKTRQLKMVKYLTFAEALSPSLSHQLEAFIQCGNNLFESLSHLTVKPTAFWSIANGDEYHRSPDVHPLQTIIRKLPARSMCVQLPVADGHLEKSYILPRMLAISKREPFVAPVERYEYNFRDRLRHVIDSVASTVYSLMVPFAYPRCEQITIHNLVSIYGELLSFADRTRIFLQPCACRNTNSGHFNSSDRCLDHWAEEERLRMLGQILYHNHDDCEFVDADWITGTAEGEGRTRIANIGERAWDEADWLSWRHEDECTVREIHEDTVVTFIDGANAEACSCCGKKQLTYQESTVDTKFK